MKHEITIVTNRNKNIKKYIVMVKICEIFMRFVTIRSIDHLAICKNRSSESIICNGMVYILPIVKILIYKKTC